MQKSGDYKLEGTVEELTRMIGISIEDFTAFCIELERTKTADVKLLSKNVKMCQEISLTGQEIVKIVSRRLEKELSVREYNKLKQQENRVKKKSMPESTKSQDTIVRVRIRKEEEAIASSKKSESEREQNFDSVTENFFTEVREIYGTNQLPSEPRWAEVVRRAIADGFAVEEFCASLKKLLKDQTIDFPVTPERVLADALEQRAKVKLKPVAEKPPDPNRVSPELLAEGLRKASEFDRKIRQQQGR